MHGEPAPLEFSARTVGIVGVGLIGGSIAAALKARKFSGQVVGVGRNAARLAAAQQAGLIDRVSTSLIDAARQADLLVFCTPVDRIVDGVRKAAAACRAGTLITDAGSVKQSICEPLSRGLPDGSTFIGSHPLAGSEKQGFEHASATLFENRVCVVTPNAKSPPGEVERLTAFWKSLGSAVMSMSPAEHDRHLATTSHLPHVVAAALASLLTAENAPLAATGFRDTTRIASGDPDLWAAILLQNADEIMTGLDRFTGRAAAFSAALKQRDGDTLKKLLQEAKANRERMTK